MQNVAMTQEEMQVAAEQLRTKAVRLVQLKAALEANKPLYEELDRLTLELKDAMGTTAFPVTLTEQESMYLHNGEAKFIAQNQVITINDNFAEKNTVFRPAGVKRFEAALETAEEFKIRLEKEAKKKAKDAQK